MRYALIVLCAAVVLIGFVLFQDSLARVAWHNYALADVALFLNRGDDGLSMQLGSYYFGGAIGKSEYNLGKAETAYKKALAAQPGILWGHYQLARLYFMKGNYNLALEEIAKELEANPENLRSLYIRGLIYGYRGQPGDLELAENDFQSFTLWAPKEWAGYNDLAWVLEKERKYKESGETLEKAFTKIPDAGSNPWFLNGLGVAELNLGHYAEARKWLEKARESSQTLSLADWRAAYPGNNPKDAKNGLATFKNSIEENIKTTETMTRLDSP